VERGEREMKKNEDAVPSRDPFISMTINQSAIIAFIFLKIRGMSKYP